MTGWRSEAFVEQSVPQAYERSLRRQLFDPWGHELVRRAELKRRMSVLDVACGPGTVAHLAAVAVGGEGRVVASDVSAAMLEVAAARSPAGGASVEYLQCPANALAVRDEAFSRGLCQQGLQFFPDRLGALRELRRALEPRGVALLSSWASERPLGLFGPIAELMPEFGISEPYPHAFDAASYTVSAGDLRALLDAAEFRDVSVETVELECSWDTNDDIVATVLGTPFGPQIAELDRPDRARLRGRLLERLGAAGDGRPAVTTVSHIARAVR